MVVHQLVERVEFDHPQEVLSRTVAQHLEVLDVVSEPGTEPSVWLLCCLFMFVCLCLFVCKMPPHSGGDFHPSVI